MLVHVVETSLSNTGQIINSSSQKKRMMCCRNNGISHQCVCGVAYLRDIINILVVIIHFGFFDIYTSILIFQAPVL